MRRPVETGESINGELPPDKIRRTGSGSESDARMCLNTSWSCPACGRENGPEHLFCNVWTCGLARPGLTQRDFDATMCSGASCATSTPALLPAAVRGGFAPVQSAPLVPPGSWICTSCNNVNFPDRAICNGRRGMCGLPRHSTDAFQACPGVPQQLTMRHMSAESVRGDGSPPPGSWVCLSCRNVNFPSRVLCNGRTCGKPREEVDGGPPTMPGTSPGVSPRLPRGGGFEMLRLKDDVCQSVCGGSTTMGSLTQAQVQGTLSSMIANAARSEGLGAATFPEGSWVCLACDNVNFPTRVECNGRGCGCPRSEIDGGPPNDTHVRKMFGGTGQVSQATVTGTPPPGSWTCPSCQNVNYPSRTQCNRRNCNLPRPAEL